MGFFLGLACATLALAPAPERPKRLVIVSWDGGADWVVDRLLAEGKLPTLAKIVREGAAAESMTQAFPSKTAAGHAAAYTGTWPRKNGVVNNSVPLLPRSEHTILESRSGFDANSHLTEPLWVTVAKAGKRAVTLSAAGSFPPAPDQARLKAARVPLDRFLGFSGFEGGMGGSFVSPAAGTFAVGDTTFQWRAENDPNDPRTGYDTVRFRSSPESAEELIKPFPAAAGKAAAWSRPIPVTKDGRKGWTYLRLFELDPKTGKAVLFVRAAASMGGTESVEENERYLKAYGGFHDTGFGPYQEGHFGKPIYAGGDGTAEERLLEIIEFDHQLLTRSFAYAWDRYKGDVYWHYTPASDGAGHCWMGRLDPASGAYTKEIADKLWPYYARVFAIQDRWLGELMRKAGPTTVFALLSDHGMEGIDRFFHPNFYLEQAGLLFRTADGKIDLTRTKVCAPPWGDNQLIVNGTDWKGGIVPDSKRESVIRAAEQALLTAHDPATNRTVVERIFRPDDAPEMGIGGPAGGDLYFDLAPSYYPRTGLSASGFTAAEMPRAEGVHGFWPLRRKMQAIFYLHGPGVARGVRLPPIRAVDVAPTLCRLLGIKPAVGYDGIAIGQALRD